MNDKDKLMNLFNRRYACKKFHTDRRVSDDDLLQILQAGRLAPSSFGLEPWKFLVIEKEDVLRSLYPYAWGAHNSLNGDTKIVVLLSKTTMDDQYVKHIMQDVQGLNDEAITPRLARLEKFQKDDFDLLKDERNLVDWTGKQVYIALAHMMIMAASMDIDSCPIEGFVKDKVEEVLSLYQLIDLKEYRVAVMVSFGYRDEPIKLKKRRSISEVVEWIK